MPISTITAMIIASRDDVICTSAGPTDAGKYVGWITLGPEDRCRPLLDSGPVYSSHEEAKRGMEKLVAEIRAKLHSNNDRNKGSE